MFEKTPDMLIFDFLYITLTRDFNFYFADVEFDNLRNKAMFEFLKDCIDRMLKVMCEKLSYAKKNPCYIISTVDIVNNCIAVEVKSGSFQAKYIDVALSVQTINDKGMMACFFDNIPKPQKKDKKNKKNDNKESANNISDVS